MKIVVIGGSGLIGSRLVTLLSKAGHQALAASPSTGVNSVTGEGLSNAFINADVVVDVTNAPSWEPQAVLDFFRTSARNLGKAEVAAGVRHHVALSIVGTDRMPENAYFAAKVAQEEAIEAAGVPYTIVRATQFMEFIGGIADFSTDGGTVRVSDGQFQPIAADDIAAILSQVALAAPLNGTIDIAGPDRASFAEIIARYLKSVGDTRPVVTDRNARYYGGLVEELSLVPLGDARIGRISLDQWLAQAKVPGSSSKAGQE